MSFLPIFLFFASGLALWLLAVRENLRQRVAHIRELRAQLAALGPSPEAGPLRAALEQHIAAYNTARQSAPARIPARLFGFGEV
jgi:plasmid stabilization system protein ParE